MHTQNNSQPQRGLRSRRLHADLGAIPGTFQTETGAHCPVANSGINPTLIGQYQLLNNPAIGQPNTGTIMIHAALVPGTMKVIMWSRHINPATPVPPGANSSVQA